MRPRDCSSCPLTALAVTAVGDNWPRLTTARPRRENPRPGEGASHTAAAAGPPRTRRGGRSSWNTHPHLLLPLTWTSQPQLCLAKTQLLRDSSWLRTQLLGTYGRTDDPQWRRSCSCDGMGGGSVARGGQYSGACVVGTSLFSGARILRIVNTPAHALCRL